jgi:hypothetical protein
MDERSRYLAGGGGSSSSADPRLFQDTLNKARGAAEKVFSAQELQALRRNPGLAARLGTTGVLAGGNILQGDLLGAATSTAGGLLGGGIGSALAGLVPAQYKGAAKIAQVGLPVLGSLFGGIGAEQAGQKAAEYLGAPIPGSPEVSQRAQEERGRDFERKQQRLDYETMTQAELAANKEYTQYLSDQSILNMQRQLPIQKDLMRQQLINNQAINASNAALYQQMGRTATMGRAALSNIAEAGATTRTLLSQNPYAGAVLQAPQISFG